MFCLCHHTQHEHTIRCTQQHSRMLVESLMFELTSHVLHSGLVQALPKESNHLAIPNWHTCVMIKEARQTQNFPQRCVCQSHPFRFCSDPYLLTQISNSYHLLSASFVADAVTCFTGCLLQSDTVFLPKPQQRSSYHQNE